MDTVPETFAEALGLWLGYLVGPVFGAGSLLRRSRVFHPDGMLFHATVKPTANVSSKFFDLAKNLSGSAILRFSSSMWKRESALPDGLGCAVRFRVGMPPDIHPEEGAQDLILITSPTLASLPLNILRTQQHDFLANPFFGAVPYRVADQADCRLRLMPRSVMASGINRNEKLIDAVIKGVAALQLEVLEGDSRGIWQPVVEFRLNMPLLYDQDLLLFSPFRAGLGLQPQGLINFSRVGPYVFSQFMRRTQAKASSLRNAWPDITVSTEHPSSGTRDSLAT